MSGSKKNLSLVMISVGMCAVLTKGAKWLITFQLVREHGSRREKLFSFTYYIQLLNAYSIYHSAVAK
jgi:hypothetical protein